MPDFAMCDDMVCPDAPKCRRSRVAGTKPSDYQWWAKFDRGNDNRCTDFMPLPPPATE